MKPSGSGPLSRGRQLFIGVGSEILNQHLGGFVAKSQLEVIVAGINGGEIQNLKACDTPIPHRNCAPAVKETQAAPTQHDLRPVHAQKFRGEFRLNLQRRFLRILSRGIARAHGGACEGHQDHQGQHNLLPHHHPLDLTLRHMALHQVF